MNEVLIKALVEEIMSKIEDAEMRIREDVESRFEDGDELENAFDLEVEELKARIVSAIGCLSPTP